MESTFKVLEELNSLRIKPILSLKNMERYCAFKILNCKKVNTRYGNRLHLELEKFCIYLPERFTKISEESFQNLNEGGYYITNNGTIGRMHNLLFSKSEEDEENSTSYFHF